VIFDPTRKVIVTAGEMHSRADYDPFEGFEVTGWPKMTISRGAEIVSDRKVDATAGRGEFIARDRFSSGWRSQ
jgi:dihydropyrimidinase